MATNDTTRNGDRGPALTVASAEAAPLRFPESLAQRLADAYERQRALIDERRGTASA
jgi:hypothetical protein